jgi:hypothetical protein
MLPQKWQTALRSSWIRLFEEVHEKGLKPLTRVTHDVGLDKHARSCLSVMQNGAGKLKKRFATDDENAAPSNIDGEASEAPSKHPRFS